MIRRQLQSRGKRRGATLLVSIAILTLLAVFSIAFVRLVNFERVASANYVDAVRARMASRAGIQRAVAELRKLATMRGYSHPVKDGWNFVYTKPTADGGRPLSLLTTTTPSFNQADPAGRLFFGQTLTYSGSTGQSHSGGEDVYKLKVLDCASQFNANHPDAVSAQRILKNILRCASELDADWPDLSNAEANQLAQAVITGRTQAGSFSSKSQIMDLLRGVSLGAKDVQTLGFDRWNNPSADGKRLPLRDMLTVSSWVDPTSLRPWNLNNTAYTTGVTRDFTLLPRAPINLNTASVPVIAGVLAELSSAGPCGTYSLTYASAKTLAQAIVDKVRPPGPTIPAGTGPFTTWHEFEAWLDSPVWTPAGGHSPTAAPLGFPGGSNIAATGLIATTIGAPARMQGLRDLVKAQLNPNSIITKWGVQSNHGGSAVGSFNLPRLVDKSDLMNLGTEGCFDSMGLYEITSLGLVLGPNEREPTSPGLMVIAAQTEQVVVRCYDLMRLTTQADFEQYRAFMAPGDFVRAFDQAWTYKDHQGYNEPAYRGFEGWPGVISYPVYSLERGPQTENFPPESSYVPAAWDGYLTLSNLMATVAKPMDFNVCFARGQLEAIKVRVWWDPKDQEKYPSASSTVESGFAKPALVDKPTHGDPVEGMADLQALARPMGRAPLLGGVLSGDPNPLDVVTSGTGSTVSNAQFLMEGSALTNHGVMIDPERKTNNKPNVLIYNGENLNLYHGSSLRFYVMPTQDPFLTGEEVLFSWVGNNVELGQLQPREVGFEVVKEVNLGQVTVSLRWINRDTPPMGLAPGNDNTGMLNQEVQVDVTPGQSPSAAPDPLLPEWTPNSWHWIVVNFGPAASGPDVSATLQVDKKASGVINLSVNAGSVPYGEVHGNHRGGLCPAGGGTNLNVSGTVAWRAERLLGDWYNCDGGATVTPNPRSQTHRDAVKWDAAANSGAGDYVINGAMAPPLPSPLFPDNSYDRQITLEFVRPNNTVDHTGTMTPVATGGLGNSGWTYNFTTADLGADGQGGTADDFRVDLVRSWKENSLTGGTCACCSDCGKHDFDEARYWGQDNQDGCRMLSKSYITAGGVLPPPDPIPPQFVCDQCNGCEACDVDGPMFFGGRPIGGGAVGGPNYQSDGSGGFIVADVEPSTMATCIFDNIIIKNNRERRTDYVSDAFEDRFFETVLTTNINSSPNPALREPNFGAVYRRGLLELRGFRCRLGTLTWTSYPTTDGFLDFDVGVRRIDQSGGEQFVPSNTDINTDGLPAPGNNSVGAPYMDPVTNSRVVGYAIGTIGPGDAALGTVGQPAPSFDGTALPAPATWAREILLLDVQLNKKDLARSGLPKPIVQTPILEDVTLTFLSEQPQIVYAEEGVEE